MRVYTGKMLFGYKGKNIETEYSGYKGVFDHCEYMRYVDTKEDVPESTYLELTELNRELINIQIMMQENE